MKKILVTGGSGLLGSKIISLARNDFEIIGTSNLNPIHIEGCRSFKLDITDRTAVFELTKKVKSDVVIHTAAFTDVDMCEDQKEKAWKVNVDGTKNITDACKEIHAKVIYMSTDYIFDGKNGPYSEEDKPKPINYYGLTKLEGESIIKSSGLDYVIIRSTILYGWNPIDHLNFVTWVIDKLKKREEIKVVTDQYGNPTLADNCAEAILDIIKKNKSGIYNIVGRDWVNRFEFAKKICEIFNLDKRLISPVTSDAIKQRANRPKVAGLKIDKAQRELDTKLLNIEESLIKMKRQIEK